MGPLVIGLFPLFCIAPLLVAAAWCDLRYMRIPNVLSLAAVAVFALAALVVPPDDLAARLTVAVSVFALGFVAFAFRLFGGGDVKLLSALMLFVPFAHLTLFANVFSASMLIGIALILGLRRVIPAAGIGWVSFQSNKFPMGISIALAGLSFPVVALMLGG